MTEAVLIEFIQAYDLSLNNHFVTGNVMLYIPFEHIQEFIEIIGSDIFENGGLTSVLMLDSVCVDLHHVCRYHDIKMHSIPEKV